MRGEMSLSGVIMIEHLLPARAVCCAVFLSMRHGEGVGEAEANKQVDNSNNV